MPILGRVHSSQGLRRLRIILYTAWGLVLLLSAIVTIAGSHLLSVQGTKAPESLKLVVPTKVGKDSLSITAQPGSPATTLSGSAKTEADQLQKTIDDFTAHQPTKFGVYVKDLKSNAIAGVNEDMEFSSASLYKLYVADLIFHQIDLNNIQLSDQAGTTGYNIRDCLNRMITLSDNDCGQSLGGIVKWNLSNPIISARGYTHSGLNDPPQTSAGDTGKLLEHLYQQLDEVSNNDQLVFLELLKLQQVNDRLPAGLPPNTVIAHKTASIDDYVHDVGIVYGAKTNYVISVLSGPWPDLSAAPAAFTDLSHQIYQLIER